MWRVKGSYLVFVGADIDGTFAPDATVGLGQQCCWNELPSKPTKQHRGDKTSYILQDSSSNHNKGSISLESSCKQLQKNRRQSIKRFLLFRGLDNDLQTFGNHTLEYLRIITNHRSIDEKKSPLGVSKTLQSGSQGNALLHTVIMRLTLDGEHGGHEAIDDFYRQVRPPSARIVCPVI